MSDIAIQVDHVWKKFRKGEMHDSLRELIPAVTRRLFGRSPKNQDLNAREFWALKDVSFEVKRGESLGIIGPNGAGKSTMLKLLSRIIRPNQGEYKVNGRLSALIEVGAGFHQDLTGRENIYLSGTILGMSKKEIQAKEEQIIDFAGVEEFIETPVKRYSSGMTARLGFAVAAHMEPDVLLVDEVLSVGDARFRQKCIQHMKKLIASDVTVVFISHILEQVRQLCPRTIVLNKGEVAYDGESDGAIRKYLELLDEPHASADQSDQRECKIDLCNIDLTGANNSATTPWETGKPSEIHGELVVRQRVENIAIVINFSTVSGQYLGTAHSRAQGLNVDLDPGKYHIHVSIPSIPLVPGDYSLDFKVYEGIGETMTVEYDSPHTRVVSVQGNMERGGIVPFVGHWAVKPDIDSTGGTMAKTSDPANVICSPLKIST